MNGKRKVLSEKQTLGRGCLISAFGILSISAPVIYAAYNSRLSKNVQHMKRACESVARQQLNLAGEFKFTAYTYQAVRGRERYKTVITDQYPSNIYDTSVEVYVTTKDKDLYWLGDCSNTPKGYTLKGEWKKSLYNR